MRARDRDLVAVLRSTLGAIANAEAVDEAGSAPTNGVASNEAVRRHLDEGHVVALVVAERDRLRELSGEMSELGQIEEATSLSTQAAALDRYLDSAPR